MDGRVAVANKATDLCIAKGANNLPPPTYSSACKQILDWTTIIMHCMHRPRVGLEDKGSIHYRTRGIRGYAPLPNTLAARASTHASSLQDLTRQGTDRDPTYPHQGIELAMVRFHHGNKMQTRRFESKVYKQHPK